MKRLSVLIGLLIITCSFVPAYAQGYADFVIEIESGKTFVHPDDGMTYYKANTDFYLDIKMGNSFGDIGGFTELFRFYAKIDGVETDAIPITWIGAGGTDLDGSITRMNGWEDATYFEMLNDLTGYSWDGSLPDSMAHVTASLTGWPIGDPTLTRYRFHFSIPVMGTDPSTDIVELCLGEYDCTGYDCDNALLGFGGPYCFKFLNTPFVEPTFEFVSPTLTTTHDDQYFITLTTVPSELNNISGAGAVDEYGDPIGFVTTSYGVEYVQWIFHPPCEWLFDGLTHTVSFYLEDESHGYVYPDVTLYTSELIVTEGTPPEISGDCGATAVTSIGHTAIFNFEVANRDENDQIWWNAASYYVTPEGDYQIIDGVFSFSPCVTDEGFIVFSIAVEDCAGNQSYCEVMVDIISCCPISYHDPNGDGNVDILDIVFLINYKYKDGPAPAYPPSADWNLDSAVDILDIIYIIDFRYKDGSYPSHNYSSCSGKTSPSRGCLH